MFCGPLKADGVELIFDVHQSLFVLRDIIAWVLLSAEACLQSSEVEYLFLCWSGAQLMKVLVSMKSVASEGRQSGVSDSSIDQSLYT